MFLERAKMTNAHDIFGSLASRPLGLAINLESAAQVLQCHSCQIRDLALAAGLDPKLDFQSSDLRGLSFAGQDLSGFDFSGALVDDHAFEGAHIDSTTRLPEGHHPGNRNAAGTVPLEEFERVLEYSIELWKKSRYKELIEFINEVVPIAETDLGKYHDITQALVSYIERSEHHLKTKSLTVLSKSLNLTRAQCLSLGLIIRYLIITRKFSTRQIANDCGFKDTKPLNNLMNLASTGQVDEIFYYVRDRVLPERGGSVLKDAPELIRYAVEDVFGLRRPGSTSISSIFSHVSNEHPADLDDISKLYKGIWHCFRYSAHVQPELRARELGGEIDALVVWESMEVQPRDPSQNRDHPSFEIHYRPGVHSGGQEFYTVVGTILSLGHRAHLQFVGHELVSEYPLFIVTSQPRARVSTFNGFVTRKHEQGQIFTAKVAFVKAAAHSLADLDKVIGIYYESELVHAVEGEVKSIRTILNSVVNRVPYGGKSGLV
jgi:hypothetical protein